MKPKKIIYWLIFGVIAYNVFGYTKMHTRGDVIAYKHFAKSVFRGDIYGASQASSSKTAQEVFVSQDKRKEFFADQEVLFTYYKIKNRRLSEDGKIAYITAEQVSRVKSPTSDSFWGDRFVTVRHNVQMVLENDAWFLYQFNDPASSSSVLGHTW